MRKTLDDRSSLRDRVRAILAADETKKRSSVIRIVGPPGIGKSTFLSGLVSEVSKDFDHSVRVECSALESEIGYGAIARILQALDRDVELRAARATFQRFAQLGKPTLIAIDDFQWCDAESAQALATEIANADARLTVLLGDRRDEPLDDPWDDHVFPLQRLRESAARALVRAYAPAAHEDEVSEIVSAADGIPFDLIALAQAVGADAGAAADLSLREMVAARLARADVGSRAVAIAASFVPEPIDMRLLSSFTNQPVFDALVSLSDFFVVDGTSLHFRHARLADAVRAAASMPAKFERRLLDAQLVLPDHDVESTLRAIHFARRCNEPAVLAQKLVQFARFSNSAGAWKRAIAAFEEAFALPLTPLERRDAVSDFVAALCVVGRERDALAVVLPELQRAVDAREGESVIELTRIATIAYETLEQTASIEALVATTAATFEGNETIADRIKALARNAATSRGDHEGHSVRNGAIDRWDLRTAAFAHALRGEYADVAIAQQRYEALPGSHPWTALYDSFQITFIRMSLEGFGPLVRWWDSAGQKLLDTDAHPEFLLHWGGFVELVRCGELPSMLAIESETSGYMHRLTAYAPTVTRAALRRMVPDSAHQLINDVQRAVEEGRLRLAKPCAVWLTAAYARAGAPLPAGLSGIAESLVTTRSRPDLLCDVPLAYALLADASGDGTMMFEKALTSYPYAAPWFAVQASFAKAWVHRDKPAMLACRDRFDAWNAPLFAALASERCNAMRAVDRAMLIKVGIDGATRHREADALTRREREVAELVRAGCTNREIAGRLHLSERTVEVHLRNAFEKLNVRSRTELALRG